MPETGHAYRRHIDLVCQLVFADLAKVKVIKNMDKVSFGHVAFLFTLTLAYEDL